MIIHKYPFAIVTHPICHFPTFLNFFVSRNLILLQNVNNTTLFAPNDKLQKVIADICANDVESHQEQRNRNYKIMQCTTTAFHVHWLGPSPLSPSRPATHQRLRPDSLSGS